MRPRGPVPAALALAAAIAASAGGAGLDGKVALLDHGTPKENASEVVVWIPGLRLPGPVRRRPGRMESFHKSFVPRVLAVEVGQPVDFPNEDRIFHNVFSVSGANRFDLGLYRRGTSRRRVFTEPGLVRVYCNIHPQMVGYIRVVDSSFFAVTGRDGAFAFAGVPAGSYTVRAWCEAGGESETRVAVAAGAAEQARLAFDVTGWKMAPHKNKYGKDYPPPPPDEDRY